MTVQGLAAALTESQESRNDTLITVSTSQLVRKNGVALLNQFKLELNGKIALIWFHETCMNLH
jgi:hypothetical protein